MIKKIIYEDKAWIDIKNPNEKDVAYLAKKFPFIHAPVLNEIIPPGHRAKVERHKRYLFMMLYYPIFNPDQETTRSREVDIIITEDTIITSHYKTIIPLKKIFDQLNLYPEKKAEYMKDGPGILLYQLITGMLESALNKLLIIEKNIDEIEDAIFSGKEKESVFSISYTKRDILNFRRILIPQGPILESLTNEGLEFFGEHMKSYLADIVGSFSRVKNTVEEHRETIQALGETNDSLLTAKINEIMKVLTIFSVLLLPLTLLSGIWGMNISFLPFAHLESPWNFLAVIIIMAFVSSAMIFFFKIKKWF